MGLIAVPNVSEGRDAERIAALADSVARTGSRIVDVHSDDVHDRTVFTLAGEGKELADAAAALACVAARILDLTRHEGAHPRIGTLDVYPLVPHTHAMATATQTAAVAGETIASRCGLPVYFYGHAARRNETRELPDLRRGGLEVLTRRAASDLPPDLGPSTIDPRVGVVCVGARSTLIAFNVWLESPIDVARAIAARIRTAGGGSAGIRALGIEIDARTSQVSLNLIEPERTGIDDAFTAIEGAASELGTRVLATEIVGVPPERFMPDPKKEAARLLKRPGRSLERALA